MRIYEIIRIGEIGSYCSGNTLTGLRRGDETQEVIV